MVDMLDVYESEIAEILRKLDESDIEFTGKHATVRQKSPSFGKNDGTLEKPPNEKLSYENTNVNQVHYKVQGILRIARHFYSKNEKTKVKYLKLKGDKAMLRNTID